MYYPILPHRPLLVLFAAICATCVYYSKEINMINKTSIETQLDCRATASLRSEIAEDLSKPDRPMTDILSTKDEDKDESEDQHHNSD